MIEPRRFPPPWSVEDIGGCFAVKASNGHLLWGRYRPPIPREVIDPQRRTTDRGGHRQAAGVAASKVIRVPVPHIGVVFAVGVKL